MPKMVTVEAAHLQLMQRLVAAIAQRDRAAVEECLTKDVVLNVPGTTLVSGTFEGRDDVMDALGRFAEMGGEKLRVRLHEILANETHGVVMYDVKAERDGKEIAYRHIDVYLFRDGLISEITGWPTEGFSRLYS
jgi:ketosteroid isomerase-like protein